MTVVPEIYLGPPGTGKTTKLIGLVEEELAAGTAPDRIGYVSFTKRAAGEATERACTRFGLERRDLPHFRTLHSAAFAALGLSSGDVLEGRRLAEFGDWLGVPLSEMRLSEDGTLTGYTPGDRALFMENLARVRGVPLREQYDMYHDDLPWSLVERISRGLAEYKRRRHLLDYTDMLAQFAAAEWVPHLDVLFVDEAQDLSALQWRVVWRLAQRARRVVVAGDDDQAIYRWAGADVDYFVDLQGDARVLGQSWRCPPAVQELSAEVIGRVSRRRPKAWAPREGAGEVRRVGRLEEVDLWGEDVLVLGRNAFVLRDAAEYVRREGVIFEWRGHSSVSQPILEAVRLWEALRRGEAVTAEEARRVYEYMSSGQGVARGYKTLPGLPPAQPVTLAELRATGGLLRDDIWHEALDRIPAEERAYLIRARQKGETTTGRPRVRLSTIHGAKGGEADHVVIMRDVADRTWEEAQINPDDEARVWYVAVTRAKSRVTVVAPQSRASYDV